MNALCTSQDHALRSVHAVKPFVQRSPSRACHVGRARQRTVVRAEFSSQGQGAIRCVKGVVLGAAVAAGLALSSIGPAAAAGVRMKGFPGGSGGGSEGELSEKYMQGADKKRLQFSKRKEALAKRRQEALRSGGTSEAPASGDKESDPEVIAANEEVERSNAAPLDLLLSGDAERAAEAEKLMAGIRNRASGYTKQADKKPGLLQ